MDESMRILYHTCRFARDTQLDNNFFYLILREKAVMSESGYKRYQIVVFLTDYNYEDMDEMPSFIGELYLYLVNVGFTIDSEYSEGIVEVKMGVSSWYRDEVYNRCLPNMTEITWTKDGVVAEELIL